jgi:putative DNA primase/helicase
VAWESEFPAAKKSKDGEINSSMNRTAIADWFIATAHKMGVYDPSRVRGRGASLDDGRFVMHFGDYLVVDGVKSCVTDHKSRYVYEKAIPLCVTMPPKQATIEDGARLLAIAERFRWTRPASAVLLAGWSFLAPVCGALKWRPHIWLTGGAGCGKSTILEEYAHTLMNNMDVFAQGNSSEAGIRQRLRCDALPVLFDESESNNDREAGRIHGVLALIRQASTDSAAQTLKGTAHGDAMQFHVRSMFCLSSIQVSITNQADIDRLTVLSLLPRETNGQKEEEWAALKEEMYWIKTSGVAGRVVRRCLDMFPQTQASIAVFVRVAAKHFGSQRVGDQYGTMLAGAWMLTNEAPPTDTQAAAMIDRYDWSEHHERGETNEAERCYIALMEARVRTDGGTEYSIAELISSADEYADRTLIRYGMKRHEGMLCISNTSNSFSTLFRNTVFEAEPRAHLRRLPGAERGERIMSFLGAKARYLAVPMPR